MILNVASAIVGFVFLLLTLGDIFQSVIVPRPSPAFRPSGFIARVGWHGFLNVAFRIKNNERREDFLATFAPFVLMFIVGFWVAMLAIALGFIFWALRHDLNPQPANFWAAIYYAGTSLLTLGYGDIAARSGLARALSLVSGAVGLATFAITTSFLFSLFAAFQQREVFIVTMRERTGAPPSGIEFIERHYRLNMIDEIGPTFNDAQTWMAQILETHLAYPVLTYFRSSHDHQSWVATVGALLDASTLIITTLNIDNVGPATMLNRLGRHLVDDFTHFYDLDQPMDAGVERAEFVAVYERLRALGAPMHPEEHAWQRFASVRATYAGPVNAIAQYLRIPPAQWIGDRSPIANRHMPVRPAALQAESPH